MGRRKTRSRQKKQPVWELDDEHRMLGCLDCHIESGTTDRAELEETIRQYLEDVKKKKFSLAQIDARLQQLQDIASSRQKRRQSIFAKGSQVLKNISPWDTKTIREYKEGVRDHVIATIIHSEGRNLRDTPQRMQREHSKASTPAMPTPNKRKYGSTAQQPTERGERHRKRLGRSRAAGLQPGALKEEPSSTRKISLIPSHDQTVPDSDDGTSSDDQRLLSGVTVEVVQVPSCQSVADAGGLAKTTMEEAPELLQKDHEALQPRLQAKLHEVSIMHVRTAQELQAVRAQYEEAAETVISLKRALSEADQRRGNEVTKALAYQEKQIASLENIVKKMRNSAFFAGLTIHTPFGPSEADIRNSMTKIRIGSRKLITPLQDRTLLLLTLNKIDEYLLSLLHRSSGLWLDHGVRLKSFLTDLNQLGMEVALCALTTAALCEWVFADNFESDATGPSLLLDMYQHHISMADGRLALRNLDLAARSSFFQSEDYRQIQIPCRAEALARRFVDAVAPLFTASDTPPLGTPSLDSENGQELHDELVDIFIAALGLKATLVASSDRFIILLPRPGSKFDPAWMQAESKEGLQMPKVTQERSHARVCTLPGILAYNESDAEPRDYRLQLSDSPENRSNMHILHKAVVLSLPDLATSEDL
ncbi:predicted protein [Aspergillus terreus NIH2624]|uniref:Uncharacterized protein n=1 Tax=Aspergillus terreus (strain NIH 2624 / FGSC A1156) TaxID=341663 RepID=Q0CE23_ASPTN|nr:uncharacterized protein ATEG_08061 [Aspergillus terreus NIH2624]EAU31234.1 predicted protein [Aspergillus terreus NIH2624]